MSQASLTLALIMFHSWHLMQKYNNHTTAKLTIHVITPYDYSDNLSTFSSQIQQVSPDQHVCQGEPELKL